MRPVLDAWVQLIAAARAARVPVIYGHPSTAPMAPTSSCRRPAFAVDRRAAAHQRCRGHGRGRLPRHNRAATPGMRAIASLPGECSHQLPRIRQRLQSPDGRQ
jgi:hypothetical protein